MQTASEPPSHNVTREGEEEGGKGDNPDTLGPCVMDGCSNTTYYDGPFCTAPDCGNVHMGSCPAAKPGVGSGSRPGDRVLADFGFSPISGSRLCSEARPGNVPHFDCHRESLMASTLLNDQELAPLLATPIGGRYNNPASTSGLEWQSGSSERCEGEIGGREMWGWREREMWRGRWGGRWGEREVGWEGGGVGGREMGWEGDVGGRSGDVERKM